jgi:16S rRNA A1518/A1519 N6-dimethyltransferase RsmA/KsgA/DIM1 with predicted DNA glycosylase/AP lyase activity
VTLCEERGVDYQWLRLVVRGAFQSRRKTMINSLRLAPALSSEVEILAAAIEEAEIPQGTRADSVTPRQFVALAAVLKPITD